MPIGFYAAPVVERLGHVAQGHIATEARCPFPTAVCFVPRKPCVPMSLIRTWRCVARWSYARSYATCGLC